uniref:BT1926 family outer membrane beta-barrel protein n=1 Tax=Fulvivirga sp. TaxID=1931237 RepID=UPI004048FFEC
MKKYILYTLMFLCSVSVALAQDDDQLGSDQGSGDMGYAPSAGDFSGAILFGKGLFLDLSLDVPNSFPFGGTVDGSSPTAYRIVSDQNSASNMIGGEARYFITDRIAVKLGGAAIFRNTPDEPNAPAPLATPGSIQTIPDYAAVDAVNEAYATVNLAGEYHFDSKYDRLFPYVGLNLPFHYGRYTVYDPTVTGGNSPTIIDYGDRSAELLGFGAQAAAGVDYYLMEGFFFGFEIKPISFIYAYTTQIPAPGLEERQAETTTLSFFTQPFLKVGFRF